MLTTRQLLRSRLFVRALEERTVPTAGMLDPSFDGDGRTTLRFPNPTSTTEAVAVDGLGRIVVAGATTDGSDQQIAVARFLSDGSLDSTFAEDGRVTVDFGSKQDNVKGVAIDSQDRVILVGYTWDGATSDFAVIRLTNVGTLDPAFSGDGKTVFGLDTGRDDADGVAIDAQDRIIVAGSFYGTGTDGWDMGVVRLLPDGNFDPSFSNNGIAEISVQPGSFDYAYDVDIDTAGRIIMAGGTRVGETSTAAVVRLTTDGSLDSSFDVDGRALISFGGTRDIASAVAVDSLDRVIIAGASTSPGTNSRFAVARLTALGETDVTFAANGVAIFDFGGVTAGAIAVEVDQSDRVVVAGDNVPSLGGGHQQSVARLTSEGKLDTSFSGDGQVALPAGPASQGAVAVVLDVAGRILLGGTSPGSNAYSALGVSRLTNWGAIDSTFGGDGNVTADFLTDSYGIAWSTTLDQLGRIIAVGDYKVGAQFNCVVARYRPNGTLDPTFGGDGKLTFSLGADAHLLSVHLDKTGRILVAGGVDGPASVDAVIARLLPNGAFDDTFANGGIAIVDLDNSYDRLEAVTVDDLGRIIASGYTNNGDDEGCAVLRFTSDGELDPTFGSGGKVVFQFVDHPLDKAGRVLVDDANRLIVVGRVYNSDSSGAAVRLLEDGNLDATFGTNGVARIAAGLKMYDNHDAKLDSMGRLIMVGNVEFRVQNLIQGYHAAVARFTPNGMPDTSFSADGYTSFGFNQKYASMQALSIDLDDRILVGGFTSSSKGGNDNEMVVARLTPSGALDVTFDGDGKSEISFGASVQQIRTLAVDWAGRTVVAGMANTNGFEMSLARLTADNAVPPPANVVAVTVNGGAIQRSMVTSLQVTFDSKVTFIAAVNAAFQLNRVHDGAKVDLLAQLNAAGTEVTLTFAIGPAVNLGGSLADGQYRLTVVGSQFAGSGLDINGDSVPGDNYVSPANSIHRLFGDSDGDGDVDASDFGALRSAFGGTSSIFDFDNDGDVDTADLGQFRARFGMTL